MRDGFIILGQAVTCKDMLALGSRPGLDTREASPTDSPLELSDKVLR